LGRTAAPVHSFVDAFRASSSRFEATLRWRKSGTPSGFRHLAERDTDLLDLLFHNGFEDALVNGLAGDRSIPAAALRASVGEEAIVVLMLDDAQGEAARVYMRQRGDTLQYALAQRASSGRLRLEAWRTVGADPGISWTARSTALGWVLETVVLR